MKMNSYRNTVRKRDKRNERSERGGFTLVEVIVVLVILAVLAAIMIPALTGWIDKAQKKKDIVAAKAMMTATQAEFSELYGTEGPDALNDKSTLSGSGNLKDYDLSKKPIADRIKKLAGDDPYMFFIGTGKGNNKTFQVYFAGYWADKNKSKPVYFDGTKWTDVYPWEGKADGENMFQIPGYDKPVELHFFFIANGGKSNLSEAWGELHKQ